MISNAVGSVARLAAFVKEASVNRHAFVCDLRGPWFCFGYHLEPSRLLPKTIRDALGGVGLLHALPCKSGHTLETQRALVNVFVQPDFVCLVLVFGFCLQTYTVNTFLTHRWVVMLNGAEVKTWLVKDRQEKQSFVLFKADL